MTKALITSPTRCKLKDLQSEYSAKYTAEEFLYHEESYILDSFLLLFEDIKKYFGKSLLMLDGYYLTEEEAEGKSKKIIKSIHTRFANKCSDYKNLSTKFNQEYSTILSKVKAVAKSEPTKIISISHELMALLHE